MQPHLFLLDEKTHTQADHEISKSEDYAQSLSPSVRSAAILERTRKRVTTTVLNMNTGRDHNTAMSASDHDWIMGLMRRRGSTRRPRTSPQTSTRESRKEGYRHRHRRPSYHHHDQHSRKKSLSNHDKEKRHNMTTPPKKTPSTTIHRPCLHRRITDSTADSPLSVEDIDIPFVVIVSRPGDTTSDRDDIDDLSEISCDDQEDYRLFETTAAFKSGRVTQEKDGLGVSNSEAAPLLLEVDSSSATPSFGVTNRWGITTLCLEEGPIGHGILERNGDIGQLSDSVIQQLLVSKSQQRVVTDE